MPVATVPMVYPEEFRCVAPGCERRKHDGDYCNPHFRMSNEGLSLWAESVWVARRLSNVRLVGECFEWQGSLNENGYGKVSRGKTKGTPVHRWFFERFVSPLPDDLVIDHLCRNPACVNPKHLEPVTQTENVQRGARSRGYNEHRTHCSRGHEWIPENQFTYFKTNFPNRNPVVQCRLCRNLVTREYKARRRAERSTSK